MERDYNHYIECKYSINKKRITDSGGVDDINNMPTSEHMPDSEQKRPPLTANDRKITDKQHMPDKKKNSKKFPYYDTAEDFMSSTNYRK